MTLLENKYYELCKADTDISEHLPILFKYGNMVDHITEFGVRKGVSTISFLYAAPKRLISYDITGRKFDYKLFKKLAPSTTNFTFIEGDVLNTDIEETDLLFIDTYHSYSQLSSELRLHGNKAKKFLIFHDTVTYGTVGMDKKEPALQKAIYEFLNNNKQWILKEEFINNNGLIVLERIDR